jgi:D-serine deaminase-like pyridoxal phosphate-dependent protein
LTHPAVPHLSYRYAHEEAALSLNDREQRILSRVAEEFARSAPVLVTLLHGFNRLAIGEAMPPRKPLRRLRRRLSTVALSWTVVTVWTLTTIGMVTAALLLSHLGHGTGDTGSCRPSSLAVCSAQAANAP